MSNPLRSLPGNNLPDDQWQEFLRRRGQLANEIMGRINLSSQDDFIAKYLNVDPGAISGLAPEQKQSLADAMRMQDIMSQEIRQVLDPGSLQRMQIGTSEYNDLLGIADAYGIQDPEKYDIPTLLTAIDAHRMAFRHGQRGQPERSTMDKLGALNALFAARGVTGLIDVLQKIPGIGDSLAKTEAIRGSDRWLNKVAESMKMRVGEDWEKAAEITARVGDVAPAFLAYGTAWKLLGKIGYLAPAANVGKGTIIARTALRGALSTAAIDGGGDSPISQRVQNIVLGGIGGGLFGAGGRTAMATGGAFIGAAGGGAITGDTEGQLIGGGVGALLFGLGLPLLMAKSQRSFPTFSATDTWIPYHGPREPVVPREIGGPIPEAEWEVLPKLKLLGPGDVGTQPVTLHPNEAPPPAPTVPGVEQPVGGLPSYGSGGRVIRLPGEPRGEIVTHYGTYAGGPSQEGLSYTYAAGELGPGLYFARAGTDARKLSPTVGYGAEAPAGTGLRSFRLINPRIFELDQPVNPAEAAQLLAGVAEPEFTTRVMSAIASGEIKTNRDLYRFDQQPDDVGEEWAFNRGLAELGYNGVGDSWQINIFSGAENVVQPATQLGPIDVPSRLRVLKDEYDQLHKVQMSILTGPIDKFDANLAESTLNRLNEIYTEISNMGMDPYEILYENKPVPEVVKPPAKAWYVPVDKAPEVLYQLASRQVAFFPSMFDENTIKLEFPENARLATSQYPEGLNIEGLVALENPYMAGSVVSGKAAPGQKFRARMEIDPSIRQKQRGLYTHDLGVVGMREGTQNSYDALRLFDEKGKFIGWKPGAKVIVKVDTQAKTMEIIDNGVGMSPTTVGGPFINYYGSGDEKGIGNTGGYGIGMSGPMSIAKTWEVDTRWRDPETGKVTRTTGGGRGADVMNPEGVAFESFASQSQNTGTRLKLEFEDEEPFNVELDGGIHSVEKFAVDFLRNSIADIKTEFWLDGKKISASKGVSGTDNWHPDVQLNPDGTLKKEVSYKLWNGAADIDVYIGAKTHSGNTIKYQLLNNGLYQGEGEYELPAIDLIGILSGAPVRHVPVTVRFDIKPKVKPDDVKYPFAQDRSKVKWDVQSYINKFMKRFESTQDVEKSKEMSFILRNPAKVPGTDLAIYTTDPGISNVRMQEILDQFEGLPLAPLMESGLTYGRMLWALMKNIYWSRNLPEPEFGGLSISGKYLGVNINRKAIATRYKDVLQRIKDAGGEPTELMEITELQNKPHLILHNPFLTLEEVLVAIRQMTGRNLGDPETNTLLEESIPEVAYALGEQTWNTMAHEIIHQQDWNHDNEFAGTMTRILSIVGHYEKPAIAEFAKHYENLLRHTDESGPAGLLQLLHVLQQEWTKKNIFEEVGSNDGVYLGDAVEQLASSNAGGDASSSLKAGYRAAMVANASDEWAETGVQHGRDLEPPSGASGDARRQGPDLRGDNDTELLARNAAQLSKQSAVLQTPALDELASHGTFTDTDVAQALIATNPGQASVIRNVTDPEGLLRTAGERGMDTSNWQFVERGGQQPDGSFRTDIIISPRPLTQVQLESYWEHGIFEGMEVTTPSGVKAIAGKKLNTIEYMDGSGKAVEPWENLQPSASTHFVEDSPQMYDAFRAYAEGEMNKWADEVGIAHPEWLGQTTSQYLPLLIKKFFDTVGIKDTGEQALLELYFDRARIQDFRNAMPAEERSQMEALGDAAKKAIAEAYVSGHWNLDSTEELANFRGFDYDPVARVLINKFTDERVPVPTENAAKEFLKNYTGEVPDVTPVTDVPFEVMPTNPGGETLDDGHMPWWSGAEEFFDSVERTADVIEDMTPGFLHDAKSTGGGGGLPPRTPPPPPAAPPPPPPGGTELPSGGPIGKLPGKILTLERQFAQLNRDDPRRFFAAMSKTDSNIVQWFWAMRSSTMAIERHLVKAGLSEATLWRDYDNIVVAMTKSHNAEQPFFDEWASIVAPFRRLYRRNGTVVRIEELSNWNDKLRAMQEAGYTPEEMAAQSRIRPFFDRMHGLAEQLLGRRINYIFDYIPLLRRAQNFSKNPWDDFEKQVPTDLSWFALHARHYGVQARQLDIASLGSIYIRGLFHEMYIKEPWEAMSDKWDKPGIPENALRQPIHNWLAFVRTGINPGHDPMIQGVRHLLNVMGVPVTDGDIAGLWGTALANSYRGMMGWSPYHIFRDSVQPWMTGTNIGFRWTAQAYIHWFFGGAKARQEMWDLALKHGWVEKGMTRIPLAEIFTQPVANESGIELLSPEMAGRREVVSKGIDFIYDHLPNKYKFGVLGTQLDPMTWYTHLGEFNRIISGYAGWLRAKAAIEAQNGEWVWAQSKNGMIRVHTATGKKPDLMQASGANYYPLPIRNLAQEHIKAQDMESLAGLLAREAANTQMRYGSKEHPLQVRKLGMLGRLGIMLGSFTNQYVSYAIDGLDPRNGGLEHSLAFAARYAAVWSAITLAAAYTGWKGLSKLHWHKSLGFGGGPMFTGGGDIARVASGTVKALTGEMPSPSERAAAAQVGINNPFSAAINPAQRGMRTVSGIMNSLQTQNPIEATARFLTTGEAGSFRDWRNYFNEGWKEQLEQQQTQGVSPEDAEVLRERARQIRSGAGYTQ